MSSFVSVVFACGTATLPPMPVVPSPSRCRTSSTSASALAFVRAPEAAKVAAPTYGCGFSRAARGDDAPVVRQLRTRLPACPAGSASAGF